MTLHLSQIFFTDARTFMSRDSLLLPEARSEDRPLQKLRTKPPGWKSLAYMNLPATEGGRYKTYL
jgi:hypothetical protein